MRFAFYTLGCKVNQFETQAMESICLGRGHLIVPFEGEADVYIINTCTVTSEGDRKSRQAAGRARAMNTSAIVAMCGCYCEVSPDEAKRRTGADIVWGNRDHIGFIDTIEGMDHEYSPGRDFEFLPSGGLEGHTRALLKVQDGCDNYCSYCAIPRARGHVRSLSMDRAVSEVKRLAGEGFLEIVVTGIEIASYGRGPGESGSLADLVEAICLAAPGVRIRLGSLHPDIITEDFCRRMAALPNLCRHFHPSLQSGCDRVLGLMNRRYTAGFFSERLGLLRSYMPGCGLTTDLICGFPGETEDDFEQTLRFLENSRFLNVHVFPYSKRPGTRAAAMEGRVPKASARARCGQARELVGAIRRELLSAARGGTFEVLFEGRDLDELSGYSREYIPFFRPFAEEFEHRTAVVKAGGVKDGRVIAIAPGMEEKSGL